MIAAGFSRLTSMVKIGQRTLARILKRAALVACPPHSSVLGQDSAGTSGFSSLSLSQRAKRVSSAHRS